MGLAPPRDPVREAASRSDDLTVVGRVALHLDPEQVLRSIDYAVDEVRRAVGADHGEFFLMDSRGLEFLTSTSRGDDDDAFRQWCRFPVGTGFPGIVAQSAHPVVTRDLASDPRYVRLAVKERGYQAYACVPVLDRGRVLGAIGLAWKRRGAPIRHAERLAAMVATPIATALRAAIAGAAPCRPVDAPPEEADAEEAEMDALARHLGRVAEADEATVVLFHPGSRAVRRCVSTGDRHLLCDRLCVGRCADPDRLRGPVVLAAPRRDWPATCRSFPHGLGAVVHLPLVHGGQVVGLAFLGWARRPPSPATRYVALATAVAERAMAGRGETWSAAPAATPEGPEAASPSPSAAADPVHLDVRCLGPLEVRVAGRLISAGEWVRRKSVEVLEVLLLHGGRPVGMEDLAACLWPEADLDAALASLHVSVHALRRVVEPAGSPRSGTHVKQEGRSYRLDPESGIAVDLWRFQHALVRARAAEAASQPVEEVSRLYEAALAIYRADLFADSRRAPWCADARRQLREDRVDAVLRLARLCRDGPAAERPVALLRQAIEADPLREDVHRCLMQALWNAGRRADALRQYRDCVDALREGLQAAPMAETRRLYEWMRGALREPVPGGP